MKHTLKVPQAKTHKPVPPLRSKAAAECRRLFSWLMIRLHSAGEKPTTEGRIPLAGRHSIYHFSINRVSAADNPVPQGGYNSLQGVVAADEGAAFAQVLGDFIVAVPHGLVQGVHAVNVARIKIGAAVLQQHAHLCRRPQTLSSMDPPVRTPQPAGGSQLGPPSPWLQSGASKEAGMLQGHCTSLRTQALVPRLGLPRSQPPDPPRERTEVIGARMHRPSVGPLL